MHVIEICRKAAKDGALMVRPCKKQETRDCEGKLLPEYDVKELFTGKKRGWVILDSFSASAVVAVYEALSAENKAKANRIPLMRLVDFAFQHVK